MTAATPALAAESIRVRFGGVAACDDVTIRLDEGEIVGLTGPNGSGKSTFLNALHGLVPAAGRLEVRGVPVDLGAPRAVRARGVVRAFQTPQVWAALSTLENVLLGSGDRRDVGLGAALLRRPRMLRRERDRWARAGAALARVGLAHLAATPVSALTYGQQRLVELARAIAGEPSVLLLDEPAAGLNAAETRFLAEVLASLRDEGVAILVVDHKIDFLDSTCRRLVVLQLGRVIAEGPPAEVWRHEDVIAAYLGIEESGT